MINENVNTVEFAKDAPTFLGKHEYGRLREAIHTSQLPLLREVLLRSLKVLHEYLREIPVEGRPGFTLFDQKIDELCSAFRRLQVLPDLYFQESETFRNIAVTAFVFYRVLYRGVYEAFLTHYSTKASFDVDPNILYKRVPYKIYDLLGGQFWRIYEFYQVIESDLSELKLNADVITFITAGIGPVSTNTITASAPLLQDSAEVITAPIEVASSIEVSHTSLISDFQKWMQKQLDENQLRINENGVYSAKLKYGTDLFVESRVLDEYSRLYQKNTVQLKDALREKHNRIYKMKLKQGVVETYRVGGLAFIFDEFNPQEFEES